MLCVFCELLPLDSFIFGAPVPKHFCSVLAMQMDVLFLLFKWELTQGNPYQRPSSLFGVKEGTETPGPT